jgi:hypothetical protein
MNFKLIYKVGVINVKIFLRLTFFHFLALLKDKILNMKTRTSRENKIVIETPQLLSR